MHRPETPKEPGSIQPPPELPAMDHESDRPDVEKLTEPPRILAELVIEEISIDGVCGIY